MGRIHSGYDVYLGDDLAFQSALIAEDQHAKVVRVKAKTSGGWSEVYRLTDTGPLQRTVGSKAGLRWEGTNDGERVTLTALHVGGGCVPCSKR